MPYVSLYKVHSFSCNSANGRIGGEQNITIGPDCYYPGMIKREMIHAVCFTVYSSFF